MNQFSTVAEEAAIATTVKGLEANGFVVTVAENGEAALVKALALLPKGAEVLTVTSQTVEKIGLASAINESGDYDAVRPKLTAMQGDESKKSEQRRLAAAPEYVVGSVHAVSQDGHVLIASATGSQLPAYTYGAAHVIWIVGAQKIVKNMDEAWKRLEQYVFPLENERAKQAYGAGSSINKALVYNKEVNPGRVHIVLAKEALGF